MARLPFGGNPSARTKLAAGAASPSMTLRPTARWISSSVGIGEFLPGAVEPHCGARRLVDEDGKGRQVGGPLDQRGNRAKSRKGLGVERPDLGDDARALVVDAQPA